MWMKLLRYLKTGMTSRDCRGTNYNPRNYTGWGPLINLKVVQSWKNPLIHLPWRAELFDRKGANFQSHSVLSPIFTISSVSKMEGTYWDFFQLCSLKGCLVNIADVWLSKQKIFQLLIKVCSNRHWRWPLRLLTKHVNLLMANKSNNYNWNGPNPLALCFPLHLSEGNTKHLVASPISFNCLV